jgi:hypothetical protein
MIHQMVSSPVETKDFFQFSSRCCHSLYLNHDSTIFASYMSALQTVALFGACLKRLTAVVGVLSFLILYVIIFLELINNANSQCLFSYTCIIFPNDPKDSNSIRCKHHLLIGGLYTDIGVIDTLEFLVYHAVLLYLHYRRENVSVLFLFVILDLHLIRLPAVYFL